MQTLITDCAFLTVSLLTSSMFDLLCVFLSDPCVYINVQAGGYFGIWTAGVAWYIAFAELLNEVWFRGRVSHWQVCCSIAC